MTQLNFDFNSEYEAKEVLQWKTKIIKETPTVADKLFVILLLVLVLLF